MRPPKSNYIYSTILSLKNKEINVNIFKKSKDFKICSRFFENYLDFLP